MKNARKLTRTALGNIILGSFSLPLFVAVTGMVLALAGGIWEWPAVNEWGSRLAKYGSLALVFWLLAMLPVVRTLTHLHRSLDETPAGDDTLNSEGKKDA